MSVDQQQLESALSAFIAALPKGLFIRATTVLPRIGGGGVDAAPVFSIAMSEREEDLAHFSTIYEKGMQQYQHEYALLEEEVGAMGAQSSIQVMFSRNARMSAFDAAHGDTFNPLVEQSESVAEGWARTGRQGLLSLLSVFAGVTLTPVQRANYLKILDDLPTSATMADFMRAVEQHEAAILGVDATTYQAVSPFLKALQAADAARGNLDQYFSAVEAG